jgi:hypothetical protein
MGETGEFKCADAGMRHGQRRLSVDPEISGRGKTPFLFPESF